MKPIWSAVVCVVLACGLSTAASAQTPSPSPTPDQQPAPKPQLGDFRDFDELNLDDLLNTTVSIASGKVQRLEEAPSIVTVVTDEDIRRMGARTLDEVLRTVPGFDVLRDQLGRSRIAVRGLMTRTRSTAIGSSENILVLFNGHRLNDHFTGGATVVNLEIPVYNIKQIEIIRGPGSALFGANAFLAVINLVPYTSGTFDGIQFSATGGSFATQQYNVVAARSTPMFGISASFQFSDTDGPKLPVPADQATLFDIGRVQRGLPPISLAPRTTSDDRRGIDFNVNANYRGFTASARVHDDRAAGFIGVFDMFGGKKNQLDSRQILFDGSQTLRLGSRTAMTARFSFTQNEAREFLSLVPPDVSAPDGLSLDFSTNSRRYAAEIAFDRRLSEDNRLTLGAGYESESTYDPAYAANFDVCGPLVCRSALPTIQPRPSVMVPDTTRTITSLFMQDAWNVTRSVGITAGLRYDHYNDFGDTINPRAGVVWRLPRRLHVKTLFGRAFRAPTLTELFLDFRPFGIGNPNLKPSTIRTVELALGYSDRSTRANLSYFASAIRNPIVGPVALFTPTGVYLNTPGLNVQGIELDVKRTFGFDHAVFANYTYQRPTDLTGDAPLEFFIRARDLPRLGLTAGVGLPSHMATLGFTAGMGKHASVTPTLILRGERPRSKESQFEPATVYDRRGPMAGYGVLNVNMRLKELFDRLEIAATVSNALDKRYTDPSAYLGVPGDYPRPGRSALITATYKF